MDGVERLGGLDLGLNRAAEPDRELEAYGNRGVEEEETVVEEVIVPDARCSTTPPRAARAW